MKFSLLKVLLFICFLNISLLIEPEKCNPECDNGICYQSKCYCEDGFIGGDCSVEIKLEGYRVGLSLFILILIITSLLGVIFAYVISNICICCCNDEIQKPDFSKSGLNLMETWEKKV